MNRRLLRRLAIVFLVALTLALPRSPSAAAAVDSDSVRHSARPSSRLRRPVHHRPPVVRAAIPAGLYDYPDMEQNFTLILKDISLLPARTDGSNILRMDDPELLKFPIAYLSEPGYWYPSDSEALGLRTYLAKGGFVIVDDFHFEQEWRVFEAAMRKVLPDGRIVRLDKSHPVFNSFFSIKSLDIPYPGRLGEQGLTGEFYGIHEGNDPSKRLMVVINYNMDIGDYMEHSGRGCLRGRSHQRSLQVRRQLLHLRTDPLVVRMLPF